jgi:VanZ family protein
LKRTFSYSNFKSAIISVAIITSVGVISEIIQIFIPSRIPAVLDVFWNFFGALFGAVLFLFLSFVLDRLRVKKNDCSIYE